MSPVSGLVVNQQELDYMNAAQKRLSADLRILEKRTTLTIPATVGTSVLPDEVIELTALYLDEMPLVPMTREQYLELADDAGTGTSISDLLMYAVIGRTLYFWPKPITATTLTAIYSYRAATMDSADEFELTGEAERVLERLVAAFKLMDDGQPELAQTELANYQEDVLRIRARFIRGMGEVERMRLPGRGRDL